MNTVLEYYKKNGKKLNLKSKSKHVTSNIIINLIKLCTDLKNIRYLSYLYTIKKQIELYCTFTWLHILITTRFNLCAIQWMYIASG